MNIAASLQVIQFPVETSNSNIQIVLYLSILKEKSLCSTGIKNLNDKKNQKSFS